MHGQTIQLDLFDSGQADGVEAKVETSQRAPPNLEPSWLALLANEFDKPYMIRLREFLVAEKRQGTVYPSMTDVFNAFWQTPFDRVRVVILGQDPYHGPGQAHGLCFSVKEGVPFPPSLANIFRELCDDIQLPFPRSGDLTPWARQGVFLLNTVLTVRANQPQSHAGKGWETFTDRVISELSKTKEHLVFVLWGRNAQTKMPLIHEDKHLVLRAPHPSPFSANQGFFGCRHFSQINAYLTKWGFSPIQWMLS